MAVEEESWVNKLKKYNEKWAVNKPVLSEQDQEKEDERLLEVYYTKFKSSGNSDKYKHIPKFYSKPPADDELLQQKLREDARGTFLQRRTSELMDNEELQKLWTLLEESPTPPDIGDEPMISFVDFQKVGEQVADKCKSYFTASVFSKLLNNDPYGRISIAQLFSYVMRKVWLQQTRIGLSLFDVQGLGSLKEVEAVWSFMSGARVTKGYGAVCSRGASHLLLVFRDHLQDLENYILELIPTLPQLKDLEESFYSFYVCTAVRKFFFFLDPLRTGKIKIQDILACGFLDDLLELRDEDLAKEAQESNWFSATSALRVYGQYLSLDTDHNGMLSRQELARYGTGTLTRVFVDRVFQECLTYDGEVDYKTYLDFVLAMENRKEPQALQYLYRLIDIKGQGYIDGFTLKYFFRAIQEQMKVHGHEAVKFEDVKDEIFDMVKPANPYRITLQDLLNSGQGETVISIITDFNGFWTYENREVLLAEAQDIGNN